MKISSGTALIIGLAAVLIVGWLVYRGMIPPHWMRTFGEEIALRSTPDPDAPPPDDARQASPRVTADHPYICFARVVPFDWDRMIVVPSGGDPRAVPSLAGAAWPPGEPDGLAALLQQDPRYQLIVLLNHDRVVADELYYTFWADLSALARPDGFTPATAVFTAAARNGTHVLVPVDPPPAICKVTP